MSDLGFLALGYGLIWVIIGAYVWFISRRQADPAPSARWVAGGSERSRGETRPEAVTLEDRGAFQ